MPQPKILIIDDEQGARLAAAEALRAADYETLEAASSDEAIRVAQSQTPDLIICDVRMKTEDDGFRALASLRENPPTAAIPIILISGIVDSQLIRRSMESGAADFLAKPFSPRQLVASVSACLERARRPNESGADFAAPLRLLEVVNDVPMLVGTCNTDSTRFEFLNDFGMSMLRVSDSVDVPKIAFSEICVIGDRRADFFETWEATKKRGAWWGNASFRIGASDRTNVFLFLTTHKESGNPGRRVTVLARNISTPQNS